jgi:hypothetical protein
VTGTGLSAVVAVLQNLRAMAMASHSHHQKLQTMSREQLP